MSSILLLSKKPYRGFYFMVIVNISGCGSLWHGNRFLIQIHSSSLWGTLSKKIEVDNQLTYLAKASPRRFLLFRPFSKVSLTSFGKSPTSSKGVVISPVSASKGAIHKWRHHFPREEGTKFKEKLMMRRSKGVCFFKRYKVLVRPSKISVKSLLLKFPLVDRTCSLIDPIFFNGLSILWFKVCRVAIYKFYCSLSEYFLLIDKKSSQKRW